MAQWAIRLAKAARSEVGLVWPIRGNTIEYLALRRMVDLSKDGPSRTNAEVAQAFFDSLREVFVRSLTSALEQVAPVERGVGQRDSAQIPSDDDARSTVLTVQEAAALLRLSKNSAYEAVHRGQIPTVRLGRRLLIPRAAVEELLQGASQGYETQARGPEVSATTVTRRPGRGR